EMDLDVVSLSSSSSTSQPLHLRSSQFGPDLIFLCRDVLRSSEMVGSLRYLRNLDAGQPVSVVLVTVSASIGGQFDFGLVPLTSPLALSATRAYPLATAVLSCPNLTCSTASVDCPVVSIPSF